MVWFKGTYYFENENKRKEHWTLCWAGSCETETCAQTLTTCISTGKMDLN